MSSRWQFPRWLQGVLAGLMTFCFAHAHAQSLETSLKRGDQFLSEGQSKKAIAAFQQALNLAIRSWGENSANAHRVRHNLARAYEADSQFAVADQLHRASFEGLRAARNAGQGRVTVDEIAQVLQNWASYDYSLGQLGEAEAKTRQALELFEENGFKDAADSARYNLAATLAEQKKYDQALKEYQTVLQYRQNRYGAKHVAYAMALEGPGIMYLKQQDFTRAETFFRERQAITTALYGPEKDTSSMENLAITLKGLGRFQEAQQLYEHYLKIVESLGLPDAAAFTRGHLADIAAYQGDWRKALALATESQRVIAPSVRQLALGLSDSEVLSVLPVYLGEAVDDAISVSWTRPDFPKVAERSAEWSINSRGVPYAAMAERLLLARDARLNGQPELFDELAAVRRQLSMLMRSGRGNISKDEFDKQFLTLREAEASLSRRIGLTGQRAPLHRTMLEVSALRKVLPADTVLVHLAKVDLRDFTSKGGPSGPRFEQTYMAWIIPPVTSGDVKMLRLGAASTIEPAIQKMSANFKAIEAARSDFNKRLNSVNGGSLPAEDKEEEIQALYQDFKGREAGLEKTYREDAAADLSRLVLHPLLAAAGSYPKWILCPDADLWLTPWNGLVLPDGRYFIEQHTLSHTVTPTDLVPSKDGVMPPTAGPPIVMSAPNYDLGVTGDQNRGDRVSLIQGFGTEWVNTLLPHFQSYCKTQARVFIGDTATEEVIKAASSPRLLFLTTHGTFGAIDPAKMPPGLGFIRENPLLRCNLTFAGCNRRRATGEPGEDGMLYGSEVLECDLRSTDLVILTACQTALGDVHAGQSAAGMRQAFQLAGARNVIATLWSVDQRASKQMVESFAASLAASEDAVAALREAQLARLKEPATRHPFYWAAFTITGRGR